MADDRMPRLLLASLLLHVVLIVVAFRLAQREPDPALLRPFVVEQVELPAVREGAKPVPVPSQPEQPQPAPGRKPSAPLPLRHRGPAPSPPAAASRPAAPPQPGVTRNQTAPAKGPLPPPAASPPRQQPVAASPVEFAVPAATGAADGNLTSGGVHSPAAGREPRGPGSGGEGRVPGAGSGGAGRSDGSSGAAGRPAPAGASFAAAAGNRERYRALLFRLIEARKEYPVASRRRAEQGSCDRLFVLRRDGSLKRVEAVTRCGYPFLDDAATRAITSIGKFPPLPREFEGGEAAFTITITFALSGQ